MVTIFDNYAATYSLLAIGFVECLALSWVYGTDRLYQDIELMLGKPLQKFWAFSWHYIAPIALFIILIVTWIDFKSRLVIVNLQKIFDRSLMIG